MQIAVSCVLVYAHGYLHVSSTLQYMPEGKHQTSNINSIRWQGYRHKGLQDARPRASWRNGPDTHGLHHGLVHGADSSPLTSRRQPLSVSLQSLLANPSTVVTLPACACYILLDNHNQAPPPLRHHDEPHSLTTTNNNPHHTSCCCAAYNTQHHHSTLVDSLRH
jgi:hypothetical protein